MLLRRTSAVVELRHAFGWSRQVGDDEADAGVQLPGVSLDLANDMARLLQSCRLVAEAVIKNPDMVGQSSDGAGQQV